MCCFTDVLNGEFCLLFYTHLNFLNCCVRGFCSISIVKHTTIQIPIPKTLNKYTMKTCLSFIQNCNQKSGQNILKMIRFIYFLKNSKGVTIIIGSEGRNFLYTMTTLSRASFLL